MKNIICETIVVGAFGTNCYLVHMQQNPKCLVVDPGAEPEKIFQVLSENNLEPTAIINTHGHVDHVGANKDIKDRFDIPLYIHDADSHMLRSVLQSGFALVLGAKSSPPADIFMKDGDQLDIGGVRLQVIHTPGHSPGSICLFGEGVLLSGDTLFCRGVGRTDFPGGSWEELERSLKEKIYILPDDTVVFPGHGPGTTIGQEKHSNPFVR